MIVSIFLLGAGEGEAIQRRWEYMQILGYERWLKKKG